MIKRHKRLIFQLSILALTMFGFSFALVPLYNVFCQVTGLNGKVDISQPQTTSRYKSDDGLSPKHHVMVEFDTNRNQQLACEFSPKHSAIQVVLGELAHTAYHVKNLTKKTITVQAIPSISPGSVAKYLKKLECFCFDQQTLKPGESAELPLRFWLEPEFPNDIHRLTLSYTLFDVTSRTKENGT